MPTTSPRQSSRSAKGASPSDPLSPKTSDALAQRKRAETSRRLKAGIGTLSTATMERLDARLPWYRSLSPADRSWVGLVAQSGFASFIEWYRTPSKPVRVVQDIFRAAPRELVRSIPLTQTLQLLRVVVEVVEARVPDLVRPEEQHELHEAVLLFSREVAFAAADVYARAAEARGAWDARLEAMVIDGLVRGDNVDALVTQSAALGWSSSGSVSVVVGQAPQRAAARSTDAIREIATEHADDALLGIHDDWLLVVLGGCADLEAATAALANSFGPAQIVIGPEVATLSEAGISARAALTARKVVSAWPGAPRPVLADDLWPERAMAGDDGARRQLISQIYLPLCQAGGSLVDTVSHYLDCGTSLEATAKAVYVHPNTVRYRLRKVSEVLGIDPTQSRAGFVIRAALIYGRLSESEPLLNNDNYHRTAWSMT